MEREVFCNRGMSDVAAAVRAGGAGELAGARGEERRA